MPKKLILSSKQAEVIDAICELGQTDLVARKLGISPRTVESRINKSLAVNQYPNRLLLAIARDRELRQQ